MEPRAAAITDRLGGATGLRWFRAPGRVNLIGDHTDYHDGFVLPLAVDRDCVVAAHPRGWQPLPSAAHIEGCRGSRQWRDINPVTVEVKHDRRGAMDESLRCLMPARIIRRENTRPRLCAADIVHLHCVVAVAIIDRLRRQSALPVVAIDIIGPGVLVQHIKILRGAGTVVIIDEVRGLSVLAVIRAHPTRPGVMALHIEVLRGMSTVVIIDKMRGLSVLAVVIADPVGPGILVQHIPVLSRTDATAVVD